MIELTTNLFVSGLPTRPPPASIQAIVSLLSPPLQSYPILAAFPSTTDNLQIEISDMPGSLLLPTFSKTLPFIHSNLRRNRPTLVHCFHGTSRSIATCLAYLLFISDPLPKHAHPAFHFHRLMQALRDKHALAEPSRNFVQQLIAFTDMLHNSGVPRTTMLQFPPAATNEALPPEFRDEVLRLACRVPAESFPRLCIKLSNAPAVSDAIATVRCAACEQPLLPASAIVRSSDAGVHALPVDWMAAFVHPARKDRLKCPKCNVSVGSFRLRDAYRYTELAEFLLNSRAVHTRRVSVNIDKLIRRPSTRSATTGFIIV